MNYLWYCIPLAGVEWEAQHESALFELFWLLPNASFIRIELIGPQLPEETRTAPTSVPGGARAGTTTVFSDKQDAYRSVKHYFECESIDVRKERTLVIDKFRQTYHDYEKQKSKLLKKRKYDAHSLNKSSYNNSESCFLPQEDTPHLVMGLNAGLAAYETWIPTLVSECKSQF